MLSLTPDLWVKVLSLLCPFDASRSLFTANLKETPLAITTGLGPKGSQVVTNPAALQVVYI